jgi:hypothetical protein
VAHVVKDIDLGVPSTPCWSPRTFTDRTLVALIRPALGSFRAQSAASTFAFVVRHSGVFRFRGELTDVAATLHSELGALAPIVR